MFCDRGESLLRTATIMKVIKAINDNLIQAKLSFAMFNLKLISKPIRVEEMTPSKSNLGTFTGSVSPSVITATEIKNTPPARILVIFFC